MKRFLILCGLSFVIFGCGQSLKKETVPSALPLGTPVAPSRLPPTAEELKTNPDHRNVKWFLQFQSGIKNQTAGDKALACADYKTLGAENDFPLKDLATIRAYLVCPASDHIAAPWKQKGIAATWFAEDVARAEESAWEGLTPSEKVNFLWSKGAIEKDDHSREKFYQDAVAIAMKANDGTLTSNAQIKLWTNSPRLNPKPQAKDLPAVISDLRRNREFDRAVELERSHLNDSDLTSEEKFNLLKGIRHTLKVAQRKDDMIKATADLVNYASQTFRKNRNDIGAAKRLLDARTLFARTLWTENRKNLALETLREARRELSNRVSMEEVYFLLGRLAEEGNDFESAEGYYAMALKERPLIPGLRDKVRWARAWALHKAKHADSARKAFAELANDAKDPSDRIRAAYWEARTRPPGEDRNKALSDVRQQDPLGYYGLLVSRDLGEKLSPLKTGGDLASFNLAMTPGLNPQVGLTVEWLIALGISDGTVRVLDSLLGELKRNSAATPEAWLALSSGYARAGEYMPLFALIGSLSAELRDRLLKEHPELLFPKPWLPFVQKASEDAHIPSELLYSIIRQESAFNPHARSGADAHGLTQLLPQIAAVHAHRHNIMFKGAEDLADPETSIRLGAWELKALFERWGNLWIPSIASYNASAEAVKSWLKNRHRQDPVEFIEEIPYDETRGYVKLVMRNQVFYQRLLATEATLFPEYCLQLAAP